MKKNLLFCLACVATLLMTSCWDEPGYSYTSTFARVVTIDRNAEPLKLVADYTGEVFKPSNLTASEQLSLYGLEGADRAIVNMELAVENYDQKLTFQSGSPIKVNPVWNGALPENGSYGALTDLYQLQLGVNYPYTWMAGKYPNIAPVIRSLGLGKYYLQPTKVYGDTLRFDMAADYAPATEKDIVDFVNFDLGTLTDTANADATAKVAVRDMVDAIASHDSVLVMVVADYRDSYHKVDSLADGTVKYERRDTILKRAAYVGYTTALKNVLR